MQHDDILIIDTMNWDPLKHDFLNKSIIYDGKNFYIKFPKMRTPFGVIKKEKTKFTLSLEYNDENEIIKSFKEKCLKFDNNMIAVKNNWCNVYIPIVKTNYEYKPTIRIVLPSNGLTFDVEFYDKNNKLIENISADENNERFIGKFIVPGSQCFVLSYANVWINSENFGISWKAKQVKILDPKNSNSTSTSFELFKSGKTIEEIAKDRNFSIGTIYQHLRSYIGKGIQINELMDVTKIEKIKENIGKFGITSLSKIKENLDNNISYEDIKSTITYLYPTNTKKLHNKKKLGNVFI